MGQIDTASAMSTFDRMEEKVLELEAKSAAVAELAGDSLEEQFLSLESGGDVDFELAQLKAQLEPKIIEGSPQGQSALPASDEASVAAAKSTPAVDAELETLRSQINEQPSP
jgi:phage shock protein A